MQITLKTGEKLELEWTTLVFEYLSEYQGGIDKMLEDVKTKSMFVLNHILYSVISANYNEHLTLRQAVKLVYIKDAEKILNFVIENCNLMTNNHH